MLEPGHRLGPYVVSARVGEGGMGVVYRAWDEANRRSVALKVLRLDPAGSQSPSGGADGVARFVREARLAASLSHPSIVSVLDAGAVGETPYLAMEWLDGASLASRMQDSRLDLAARMSILHDVADALAFAHARGVVHRDVKPGNVMVGPDGRAKLLDFGIAKRAPHLDAGTQMIATEAHVLLGTPRYMAPEQLVSAAVDARADQFSWGVMAYEVLSGVHPRDAAAPGASFPLGRARPLGELAPLVPPPIASAVHRAMAYDPQGRFSSMQELLAAMVGGPADASRTFGGGPTQASGPYATTGRPVEVPIQPTPALAPAPIAPPSPAPARSPWIFVGIGGGVATLLAVAVAVVAIAMTGGAPAIAPALGGGGALVVEGPDKDDVQFEGDASALERLRVDLAKKLEPCFDGSFSGEASFRIDLDILPDGRVKDVTDLSLCKDASPGVHLCGNPTSAQSACATPPAKALRFPKLKGATEAVSTTLAVKRR